jgi:hypothetical protein
MRNQLPIQCLGSYLMSTSIHTSVKGSDAMMSWAKLVASAGAGALEEEEEAAAAVGFLLTCRYLSPGSPQLLCFSPRSWQNACSDARSRSLRHLGRSSGSMSPEAAQKMINSEAA